MKSQATRLTDIAARRNLIQKFIMAPLAYAVAGMITPGQAQAAEMMRTTIDTLYCDNRKTVIEASARIVANDFAGFTAIATSPSCTKLPKGTEVSAGEEYGLTVRVALYGQGGKIFTGYMDRAMLEHAPAPATSAPALADANVAPPFHESFILTQFVYMCREAAPAYLYTKRMERSDFQGAVDIINANGCVIIRAGERIIINPFDPKNPNYMSTLDSSLYRVIAPIDGTPMFGYMPKAQVRQLAGKQIKNEKGTE